ncbi:MAG: hypothetical protein V1790_01845, partial [Planctomycetota bacterium]
AVEVLRKQYPKAFDEDDAELKAELEEDYDMMLAGTDSVLMQTGHTRSIEGMIAVLTLIRRPSPKHPQGVRLICTRRRTLELKPLDAKVIARLDRNPDLWCPYFQVKYREFPDAMYPDGAIYPAVSTQVLLNKLQSDIATDIHKQGRSRRLIRESTGIRPDQFDDIGSDIRWDDDPDEPRTEPVSWDRPPEIKTDYWRLYDLLSKSLDDNLQLHDPSRGAPGGNVQSGDQVELLQARDDMHLSPVTDLIGDTVSRVFERCLILQAMYQSKPIHLVGVDSRTASPFSLMDFQMHADDMIHPMVRVRTVSRSPYDKLQALENNKLLLQMGVLQAALPPPEIMRRFEMGVDASMFEADNEHRVIAREENKDILSGKPEPMVRDFHNHPAHIDEHNRERNSLRYGLALTEIKLALDRHVRGHEAQLKGIIEGQAAMQDPNRVLPPEPQMVPMGGGR